MIDRRLLLLSLLLGATPAAAREASSARVRLETDFGPILVEVDLARAPITARNFLAYVDQKRFDKTRFYRAARHKLDPRYGLVQGGIDHHIAKALAPIPHEPTSKTGLRHLDGSLSMARNLPGTAMGDFFITVGAAPYLDARGSYPGYAAFGRVVSGMPVVRRILSGTTHPGGFSATTKGQSLVRPITIRTARRVI